MRSTHIHRVRSSCRAVLRSLGVLGLLLGPAIGVTAAASTATAAEVAPVHAPAPVNGGARALATSVPAAAPQSYEAREAEAKSLESFKGGDPVVIYTSTAVLVVAAVVLIILLI